MSLAVVRHAVDVSGRGTSRFRCLWTLYILLDMSPDAAHLVVDVSGRGDPYCRYLQTCHLLMLCMQAYLDIRCHEACASCIFC